jgi:hypothetical protein
MEEGDRIWQTTAAERFDRTRFSDRPGAAYGFVTD